MMKSNYKKTTTSDPWNKGKALGQKTPFTKDQLRSLRSILATDQKVRDIAILNAGIDTMLRASDLLPLNVESVQDQHGTIRAELNIRQKKTYVAHVVALSAATRTASHEDLR